jgi:hypothetical protein
MNNDLIEISSEDSNKDRIVPENRNQVGGVDLDKISRDR